jgi:Hydrophobic surface binding protein A
MQIKTILTLGFASMALAAPAIEMHNAKFDLQSVTDTFNAIQSGIDKMVNDVKAYTGDPQQLKAIQDDSDAILKTINDGAAKVAASPAMGLMDAIGVLGPVGTLSSKVDEIIMALATKKETFTKMNLASLVTKDLSDQKNAADALVKAILANLPIPGLLGIIAGPIAKQITDKLDAGVKAWS